MINPNWARWILAGVSDHFDTAVDLFLFVEGQERDTKDKKSFMELRLDGPWYNEVSKDYWKIYVEVNILIQTAMRVKDFHLHHTNIGLVGAGFTDISIFRCGNGPDDDDSFLGCLKLIQDERKRERVVTSNFGQIETHAKIQQATVEGHYNMTLIV